MRPSRVSQSLIGIARRIRATNPELSDELIGIAAVSDQEHVFLSGSLEVLHRTIDRFDPASANVADFISETTDVVAGIIETVLLIETQSPQIQANAIAHREDFLEV